MMLRLFCAACATVALLTASCSTERTDGSAACPASDPSCAVSNAAGTVCTTIHDQPTCVAAIAANGYGPCLWGSRCGNPSAESSCATYTDQLSCESLCTWGDGDQEVGCSGTEGTTGLACASYTTPDACDGRCFWIGKACAPVLPPVPNAAVSCPTLTTYATCMSAVSTSGFGPCQWNISACADPTVASTCLEYRTKESCEADCAWGDGVCSGNPKMAGPPCSQFTTKPACLSQCTWPNGTCVPGASAPAPPGSSDDDDPDASAD